MTTTDSPPTQDDAGRGQLNLDLEQTLQAVADALAALDTRLTGVEDGANQALRMTTDALASLETRLGDVEDAVSRGHWPADQPEALEDWVGWLTDTYKLGGVLSPGGNQPAWSEVPAIRNELIALRIAARKAFGPQASAWDATSWHDQLDQSLSRVKPHRDRFLSMQDF